MDSTCPSSLVPVLIQTEFLCGCNHSPVTFKRLVHWGCLCGGSRAQGQQGESWSAELERGLGTNPKCAPIPCAHPASCRNTCSPSSWVAERTGSNWRGWRRVSRSWAAAWHRQVKINDSIKSPLKASPSSPLSAPSPPPSVSTLCGDFIYLLWESVHICKWSRRHFGLIWNCLFTVGAASINYVFTERLPTSEY